LADLNFKRSTRGFSHKSGLKINFEVILIDAILRRQSLRREPGCMTIVLSQEQKRRGEAKEALELLLARLN
jgi:hypothetical protein